MHQPKFLSTVPTLNVIIKSLSQQKNIKSRACTRYIVVFLTGQFTLVINSTVRVARGCVRITIRNPKGVNIYLSRVYGTGYRIWDFCSRRSTQGLLH